MKSAVEFEVLDAAVPADRARWLQLWTDGTSHEPTHHPTYASLFAGPINRIACAHFRDTGGEVLFPFFRRSIPNAALGLEDAITPYGYGGPYQEGAPNVEAFWDHFDAWATNTGLVSLVARLSLFDSQLVPWRGHAQSVMENVVRRLDRSPGDIFSSYEHKVRKNVRRAQREGLTVEIATHPIRVDDFHRIYLGTMDRRSAENTFHFPREFFDALHRDMPDNILYAHVLHEGVVISSELVLRSARYLYSFLGGTDERYFPMRPNDLLKHAVIEWGSANRFEGYIMGGGPEAGDGIFRYKRSFAPDGVVPFRIGTRVYRPDVYDQLVEERRHRAELAGESWVPSPSYFPRYRAPLLSTLLPK
ncbi:MAG: GNAT family N-acetyltransferase [Gemmatimonadaceae bacterium]